MANWCHRLFSEAETMLTDQGNKIRQVNEFLEKWRGAHAQLWSYTAAHATLEIRLFSDRLPGDLRVVCSPCVSIAGPVYWEECGLTVGADNSDEGLFFVCDKRASVRVVCRQMYTFENVEPLFAPVGGDIQGEAPNGKNR
jgi:hypothetical protein